MSFCNVLHIWSVWAIPTYRLYVIDANMHSHAMQYSSWATEAFFKYGGEPHFIFPTTVGPATQLDGALSIQSPPTFFPAGQRQVPSSAPLPQTLTPQYGATTPPTMHQTPILGGAIGGALGGALIGPEVKMSGKHNGLYRYLARLLRPVWNEPIVICMTELKTDQVNKAASMYILCFYSRGLKKYGWQYKKL